jgi:hypothetical protein
MDLSSHTWGGWRLDPDDLSLRHETCMPGGWTFDLLRCRTRTSLLHELMAVTDLPVDNDALGGLARALDDIFWPWLNVVEHSRWPLALSEKKLRETVKQAGERFSGEHLEVVPAGAPAPPRPASPGPRPAGGMDEDGAASSVDHLAYELQNLLRADRATFALGREALMCHRREGEMVYFEILAGSSDTIGMLLATITDVSEIDDPESLSRRAAAGHSDRPGRWRYGLAVARYLPIDDPSLCLKVMFWIPASDLPEVVSRLASAAESPPGG